MWNLSLDEIQRVKEELKGRRAALRARYDGEVQAIEADIANIETLELAATLFVAKFRGDAGDDSALAALAPAGDATPAEPGPADGSVGEPIAPRNWRALLDRSARAEPAEDDPR